MYDIISHFYASFDEYFSPMIVVSSLRFTAQFCPWFFILSADSQISICKL